MPSLDAASRAIAPTVRPVKPGKAWQYRFEYALFWAARFAFRRLPVETASNLGGGLFRRLGPRVRRASSIGRRNLRAAFPDWTDDQIEQNLIQIWEKFGRTVGEFAHLDKFHIDGDAPRIALEGREHFERVKASGRPAIFVSGHFANWETASIALHEMGIPCCVVYRAANNPYVDQQIYDARRAVMTQDLAPKGPEGGRQMVAALKKGRSIAMLVDQKLNDGVPSPFFGRDAMTSPAAARLAIKFKLPVVPLVIEREPNSHLVVRGFQPLAFRPTHDRDEDILTLTAQINAFLEHRIRARPDEWLWLHRRWPV